MVKCAIFVEKCVFLKKNAKIFAYIKTFLYLCGGFEAILCTARLNGAEMNVHVRGVVWLDSYADKTAKTNTIIK